MTVQTSRRRQDLFVIISTLPVMSVPRSRHRVLYVVAVKFPFNYLSRVRVMMRKQDNRRQIDKASHVRHLWWHFPHLKKK